MFLLHSRINVPKTATKTRRQLAKERRQSGVSYVSKEGIARLGRSMKAPCNNCRFDCHRFSETERKAIFDRYYGLGDICLQWQFIAHSIDKQVPKRRRHLTKSKTKRFHAYVYRFALGELKLRVCKEFFTNTLGISRRTIDSALQKSDANGKLIVGDLRGIANKRHFGTSSILLSGMEN